jgi:hypothetical protein
LPCGRISEVGVYLQRRRLLTAVLVGVTLTAGCSSGPTTGSAVPSATGHPASSGNQPSATETAPAGPLNSRQCAFVNDANVDLLAASDQDGARRAANIIAGYNPPTSVKNAIEHFVSTGGARFDDPDYPKNYKVLAGWVEQVCPTQ